MSDHLSRLLLALVGAAEDVEGAGVGVALVDVDHPQVDVQPARSPGDEHITKRVALLIAYHTF